MGTATAPTPRRSSRRTELPMGIRELAPADRALASSICFALLPHPDGLNHEGLRACMRSGIGDAQAFDRLLEAMVGKRILYYQDEVYRTTPDLQLVA